MDSEKTYNDKEISTILERAVELQNKDLVLDRSRIRLSDLENIAKESGIDPEYIRLAINEPQMRSVRKNKGDNPGGMPRFVETAVTIDEDLNADRLEDLSTRISAIMEEPGNLQMLGRTLVWTRDHNAVSMNTGVPFSITIRNRNGKTLIEARENVGMWAKANILALAGLAGAPLGFGASLVLGLNGIVDLGILGMPALILGGMALAYFPARAYWKYYWNKRKRKHEQIVGQVREEILANVHVDVLS